METANQQLQRAVNRYVNEKLTQFTQAIQTQASRPTQAGLQNVQLREREAAQALAAAQTAGVSPELGRNTQAAFDRLIQKLEAINSQKAFNNYSTSLGYNNNYIKIGSNRQMLNKLRTRIAKKRQNILSYQNALTRLQATQNSKQLSNVLNGIGNQNWTQNQALRQAFQKAVNARSSTLQS